MEAKLLTHENYTELKPITINWIDVSERKPNDREKVLVSCEYGVTMAEYAKFNSGSELWWAVLRIGTYEDGGEAKFVTHWMPLPDKP